MARSSDVRAATVAAALAPYSWRCLTDRMLARRVVAAADRYSVTAFLTDLAGADVGALDPVEPADPRDERVAVLVRVLQEWHWRALALDRLCADLVAVLEEWQSRRDATHSARRTPLEEH